MSDRLLSTPLDDITVDAVQSATDATDEKFLIWSYEHDMWWRPDWRGYTRHRHEAGRYTGAEADEICGTANGGVLPGQPLQEIAIAESDHSPIGPAPVLTEVDESSPILTREELDRLRRKAVDGTLDSADLDVALDMIDAISANYEDLVRRSAEEADRAQALVLRKEEELAAHDDLHRQAAARIEQLVRDLAVQQEATAGAREIIRLALVAMREPVTHTDARRAREILQKYHHECAVAAVKARRDDARGSNA